MKNNFNNYLKKALLGVMAILIYFIIPYFEQPILDLFNVEASTMPAIAKMIYMTCFQILTLALIMMVFCNDIVENFKDLKEHHMEYFKKYFKYWILALIIMMISNGLIMIITDGGISGNEETIRDLFGTYPIYVYFISVFIAPFVEELVFRKAIRNIITDNTLFILVSGLVFGGLHVIGNVDSWIDLLYLIPYCTPGFIFAYIMAKTDNVLVSSSLHFMHNGILMALQVFVLLFS